MINRRVNFGNNRAREGHIGVTRWTCLLRKNNWKYRENTCQFLQVLRKTGCCFDSVYLFDDHCSAEGEGKELIGSPR